MKQIVFISLIFILAPFAKAQETAIFDIQEPFYLAGESNEDLTPEMAARKAELEFRLANREAWDFYRKGKIDEFSYFGFKLQDVKNGTLELKDLILELQAYLTKNRK